MIDAVDENALGISVDFEVKRDNTGGYDYLAKSGEPVTGLGDKAVVTKGTGQMIQLAVVKGNATVMMTFTSAAKIDLKPKAHAFGEKVLGHL